jgi:hypothetical protein
MRRERRKAQRKPTTLTTLAPVVQRLGGIRRASRALQLNHQNIVMLVSGERRLTNNVLDRVVVLLLLPRRATAPLFRNRTV